MEAEGYSAKGALCRGSGRDADAGGGRAFRYEWQAGSRHTGLSAGRGCRNGHDGYRQRGCTYRKRLSRDFGLCDDCAGKRAGKGTPGN